MFFRNKLKRNCGGSRKSHCGKLTFIFVFSWSVSGQQKKKFFLFFSLQKVSFCFCSTFWVFVQISVGSNVNQHGYEFTYKYFTDVPEATLYWTTTSEGDSPTPQQVSFGVPSLGNKLHPSFCFFFVGSKNELRRIPQKSTTWAKKRCSKKENCRIEKLFGRKKTCFFVVKQFYSTGVVNFTSVIKALYKTWLVSMTRCFETSKCPDQVNMDTGPSDVRPIFGKNLLRKTHISFEVFS